MLADKMKKLTNQRYYAYVLHAYFNINNVLYSLTLYTNNVY